MVADVSVDIQEPVSFVFPPSNTWKSVPRNVGQNSY